MKFNIKKHFALNPDFGVPEEDRPVELRKRGGGWEGGWYGMWTMENAAHLRGKRKKTQMRLICEAFGLCPNWAAQFKWEVRRSKNLYFHPNTYTLDITHHNN